MFRFPFLVLTLRWNNLGFPQHCNLPLKKNSLDCSSISVTRPTLLLIRTPRKIQPTNIPMQTLKFYLLVLGFAFVTIEGRKIPMEHFWITGLIIALVFSSLVSSKQQYIMETPDCSTCIWYWNTAAYARFSASFLTVCN